jgi:hypothetical protein
MLCEGKYFFARLGWDLDLNSIGIVDTCVLAALLKNRQAISDKLVFGQYSTLYVPNQFHEVITCSVPIEAPPNAHSVCPLLSSLASELWTHHAGS